MGPGYAELDFEERRSEPVICFLADKTEPGAWNLPLYKIFADPFNTAGLVIDAKMHAGFVSRSMTSTTRSGSSSTARQTSPSQDHRVTVGNPGGDDHKAIQAGMRLARAKAEGVDPTSKDEGSTRRRPGRQLGAPSTRVRRDADEAGW
jgi:Fructose-1,6-bisphosphatase